MSMFNKAAGHNQNWTTQKLVNLSHNLGQAYCPGLTQAKADKKSDSWTTEKFISMSRHLSDAYGVEI